MFASEGDTSPKKGVKRTKTLKTYGDTRQQLEPTNNREFDHFHEDEVPAAATAQSLRFAEHSEHQSSMPLPATSLQVDFLHHEPAMFHDTGDTVADASSEQQRMLDQAVASKKSLSTSLTKESRHSMEQQSSSVPWTASDIANSAKSKKSETAAQAEDQAGDMPVEREEPPVHATTVEAEKPLPDDDDKDIGIDAADIRRDAKLSEFGLRKPKSSPMVEIPRQSFRKSTTDEDGLKSTQRAAKSSKRKVQEESSEPLNSDDRAIGLPKERYQPRPSRRRATQVVEEPIDYGVLPKKAAKVKRTKTTGVKTSVATENNEPVTSRELKPGVSPPGLSIDGRSGDARKENDSSNKPNPIEETSEQDESPVKRRRTIKQQDGDDQLNFQAQAKDPSVSPTMSKEVAEKDEDKTHPKAEYLSTSPTKSTDVAHEDEDKIFVKPAIPTPRPKSSAKAKRAQTTIFEDHVEFWGSRRSQNLSQQQAKRKSALQDVQNEAAPKSQRKCKSIVANDSDVEDEFAKEDEVVAAKAEPVPKKRRGRPSKADKQAQPKATDAVLKGSDEDEDHDDHAEPDESEADEPPKKRGRGRPAKAASKTKPKDAPVTMGEEEADKNLEKRSSKDDKAAQLSSQPASTPSKASAPAAEMPTPSPEKPSEKTNSTPQKAASSAAQHSPIKSSSKVALRVGLSRRHRIPPLLRMANPKPPKR